MILVSSVRPWVICLGLSCFAMLHPHPKMNRGFGCGDGVHHKAGRYLVSG